ncbi:ribosomal protein S18-alanine N-acetyltransferase [Trichothermofontia sp.]
MRNSCLPAALPVVCKRPTLEHLPAILDLDRQCLGGFWSADGYAKELDRASSQFWVLEPVVTEAATLPLLLGFGCFWGILDEAHITILGIHPDYQGQGLGQALLLSLLQVARQQGLEWATLEVRVSNQIARSLYGKFGFQEAGRRPRYYPDTGEDALLLWRGGLQHPEFYGRLREWQEAALARLQRSGWQYAFPSL